MKQLWKLEQPVVLASSSETRLNLLKSALIPVEAVPPRIDERSLEAQLAGRQVTPDAIALELARAKGAQVSQENPDRLVIAADQTLALGSEQFHKPRSIDEARAQLKSLSGKTHALHSGIVCFQRGECAFAHVASAHLTMRELGEGFLDAYLSAAGESVTRSVGAYQLEGLGAHLFDRITGEHSTILGLPLLPLLGFLRSVGAVEA